MSSPDQPEDAAIPRAPAAPAAGQEGVPLPLHSGPASAAPGGVLAGEIAQQPDTLAALLATQSDRVRALAAGLPAFPFVLIAARGSSDHAAEYARYLLPALWGTPVCPAVPSLWTRYGAAPALHRALAVGISQSGQSPDIVAVVQAARAQDCPTVAISNDGDSPLARAAAHVIELGVGVERSIAATKTYTAQLGAVAMLAIARMEGNKRAALQASLGLVPAAMRATLHEAVSAAEGLASRWANHRRCLVLARGFNLATAHEIALKLRELVRVQAQAFSVADFRHGNIALVEAGTPCLLIAPRDEAQRDVVELVADLHRLGADVATLSEDAFPDAYHLPIAPGTDGLLSPLVAVLPGQLLALAWAKRTGVDPDKPPGLSAKVVRTL